MAKLANSPYISVTGLKDAGWTDGAIKKFLGSPDTTAPNPYRRRGPATKLYLKARAQQAMNSQEWQTWYQSSLKKRKKLQQSSRNAAALRKQRLVDSTIAAIECHFPKTLPPPREIINHWYQEKMDYCDRRLYGAAQYPRKPRPGEVDDQTLGRWLRNMLRHRNTNYDELCWNLNWDKPLGYQEAYEALREEVDRQVEVYVGGFQPVENPDQLSLL